MLYGVWLLLLTTSPVVMVHRCRNHYNDTDLIHRLCVRMVWHLRHVAHLCEWSYFMVTLGSKCLKASTVLTPAAIGLLAMINSEVW